MCMKRWLCFNPKNDTKCANFDKLCPECIDDKFYIEKKLKDITEEITKSNVGYGKALKASRKLY